MHVRSFLFTTILSLSVVPLAALAANWNPLPPTTGIASSYIDHGNGTISDTRTGLMWQKTDDAHSRIIATGITGTTLSHNGNNYIDIDNFMNAWRERGEAEEYCTALELGGFSDWQLPDRIELKSIVDYGLSFPANASVFEWSLDGYYVQWDNVETGEIEYDSGNALMNNWSYWWTATGHSQDNDYNWVLRFSDGADYVSNITLYKHATRCVRDIN